MNAPSYFRPLLAAAVLLAVLASAYEAAVRGSLALLGSKTTHQANLPAPAAEVVEDSAAQEAAPLLALASPAASATADSQTQAKEQAASKRTDESLAREYHARLRECPPEPLRYREMRRAGLPAPRRYVGTVGGELATAELSWTRPDSVVGRFYFWRSGAVYSLASYPSTRVLTLRPEYYTSRAGGRWHLTRPLGPLLQGYWADSTGRRGRPFMLRENYQGGVRYETRTLTLTGGQSISHNPCDVPACSRDFLHLLGPKIRPLQGRVQFPALATRRQLVRAAHRNDSHSGRDLAVLFNDFNLLSYELSYYDWPFEGSSTFLKTRGLLDLTTGRPLSIYRQLRPGVERRLRWLLTIHLLDAPDASAYTIDPLIGWEWVADHGRRRPLAPLPPETTSDKEDDWSTQTCALTAQGLEILYHGGGTYALISYRELRPLVRPGTPLARMLRARGMW
ncbi:MAG: hypothetical protein ACRYFZ_11720 [Janthinobacterium lividum]